jgi:hypothetical protein
MDPMDPEDRRRFSESAEEGSKARIEAEMAPLHMRDLLEA